MESSAVWALGIEHDGPLWHLLDRPPPGHPAILAPTKGVCGASIIDANGWTMMVASIANSPYTACEPCGLALQRRAMSSREAADAQLRSRDRRSGKRGFLSGIRKRK